MSKAKTNASHKERVQKFKTNLKQKNKPKQMSDLKIPENPIANQYPVWNSKEKIEMEGIEFEAIYNLINLFRNAVMANESVLSRNLQNGKIKWVYKDEAGNDVPEDVVRNYQLEVQKFIEAQQAQGNVQTGPITAEEQKDLPQIDGLVDADGKPIK